MLGPESAPASQDAGHGPGRVLLGTANDTSTPFNLVSVPRLLRAEPLGRDLRRGDIVDRGPGWRRWAISWAGSADEGPARRLTGTLTVPDGPGRRPLVVALHGWMDPTRYTRGAGLLREEAALAAAGFAVLHPDYRNFAGSARDAESEPADLLGYPADVLSAIDALRRADLPRVDLDRLGLLGRSMGGGVAMQVAVARPDLVDAVLLYSPIGSAAPDVLERFAPAGSAVGERVRAAYGDPGERPAAWATYSVRGWLGRIEAPVRIHHGTADPVTPLAWSEDTLAALRSAGRDARLVTYPGEVHRFEEQWPRFMRRATAFLQSTLG